MSLLKSIHGGKKYDSPWGVRMRGSGPSAQLLGQRFHLAARRLGLNQNNMPLDPGKFRRPKEENGQLVLAGQDGPKAVAIERHLFLMPLQMVKPRTSFSRR